jgi:hypothetical protein
MFATLQDRLTKELADAGITTIDAADRFIREVYLPAHNRRFAIEPAEPGTALLPWTGGALAEILCHQEDRVVGNDNTIVFGRLRLQIEPSPLRPHFVKATVQVRRYLDDTLAIFYGPRCIGRFGPDGVARATHHQAA